MKPYELITLNVSTQEVETVQKPRAYNISAQKPYSLLNECTMPNSEVSLT